jgi:hypothetical protein
VGAPGSRPSFLLPLALLVPVLAALPAVVLAGVLLLGWRVLAARFRLPWLCVAAAAGLVSALVAAWAQWTGTPLSVLHARYVAAQLELLSAAKAATGSDATWSDGLPAALTLLRAYLAGVAPVAVPGAAILAAGLDAWLRLRSGSSPLGRREAQAMVVPARVAQRAARGVAHPPDGWALGYRADGARVSVRDVEARHHTVVCGAPGSGKTTLLRHLVAGVAHRGPVVIVDCKASRALRDVVESIPRSVVWTIGGSVTWDALRGDPTALANKLLAAEHYGPAASIYRAVAERYLQWVGALLDRTGEPRAPTRIAELLVPGTLAQALRRLGEDQPDGLDGTPSTGGYGAIGVSGVAGAAGYAGGVARPAGVEPIAAGLAAMRDVEREGVAGFAARYGVVVEGVAGRSLGAGRGALVLEEAIRAGRTVLFSLDAATYPALAAKLGAWALLDLVRVAGTLQDEGWAERGRPELGMRGTTTHAPGRTVAPSPSGRASRQCYVVVDEFSALGEEGRHIVPLLARAREAGLACLLATQGLADLAAVLRPLPQQVLQNTAVRLVLRQGSAEDAETWARTFGRYEREELSRQTDDAGAGLGRSSARWKSEYYVGPDELRVLGTGEAIVSVASVGGHRGRLERVLIAAPSVTSGAPVSSTSVPTRRRLLRRGTKATKTKGRTKKRWSIGGSELAGWAATGGATRLLGQLLSPSRCPSPHPGPAVGASGVAPDCVSPLTSP